MIVFEVGPGLWLHKKPSMWFATVKTLTLLLQDKKNGKWGGEYSAKVNGIFVCSPLFNRGFFFVFAPFFSFCINSLQWLSNWKMEMLLLAPISVAASWQQSNFLSSGINGIEQYILTKKEPMIAGLPVCHLSTKSPPSRPTTMLSDLIMSRIKSREEKKGGPMPAPTHYLSPT